MPRPKSFSIAGCIEVDHFHNNPKIKYHFISHAHSSCYNKIALNSKWKFYCSELTARILPIMAKKESDSVFDADSLKPLAMYVKHQFEGFTVTLLDANHVPGAVMFIFEGPLMTKGPVLYTGHFRADSIFYERLRSLVLLQSLRFGSVHLDNTYLDADVIVFPSRERTIDNACKLIKQFPKNTKIYITSLPLMNFEVLKKISQELKEKIGLFPLSKKIADLIDPDNTFCDDTSDVRLQTVDRSDKRIIHCDYSENCSLNEIRDFLSLLKFNRTVGLKKMLSLPQQNELKALMLPDPPCGSQTTKAAEWETIIADVDLSKIIAADTNGENMLKKAATYLFQEMERISGGLPNNEKTAGPSDFSEFEKKLDLSEIAYQVMEHLGCPRQQKLLEAESFAGLLNSLEPDKRKEYEKACKDFTGSFTGDNVSGTHKQVLSYRVTGAEFSDVFMDAYHDLKENDSTEKNK